MKTKSHVRKSAAGIGISFTLGAALALFAVAQSARGASAAELLEKGIYTEETKGELKDAARIYRQLSDDPRADRGLVAQAQLRLGLCELKLGNKPQAVSALERLTQDFPDKDRLVALVDQHMPQLLDEMIRQIEQNYILEVDRGELMETALRAIVGKLDARGGFLRTNDLQFLSTRELADANASIEQKFAGIGAVLKVAGEEVVVRSALPGSPALEGGLQAGDRIVTVNGDPLPETKALETAVRLLRGPPGTPVNLGVKRAGSEDVRDLQFVRGTIRLPSVAGARRRPEQTWDFMLDEARKIGYVRLSQIGQRSAEEVRDALSDLTARGMKAFILDLRNDPGGLLAGAVAVSDLFVERGPIVTVRGRSGETAHDATAEGTFSGFPMAVLVNRKTASAAEIVAACLQDHRRAVVVGERTFGQGIVRSLFRLSSGAGALNLPVASYFRPSGKSMNRYPNSADSDDWGVRPDDGYEVALSDEELKQYEKTREEREEAGASKEAETAFEDRQLQKALAWILAPLGRQ